MATYYKKIKGKNYDAKLLKLADTSVKGKGDGRISLKDAKKILGAVKDSSDYTDIEKNTMKYIRDSYSFTPEANAWVRTEIRKWAAAKKTPAAPKKAKVVKREIKKKVFETEEIFTPPTAAMVKEPARNGKISTMKTLLIIVAILAIFIIGALISPAGESWRKKFFGMSPKTTATLPVETSKEAAKIAEPIEKEKPAQEVQPAGQADDGQIYTVQPKDDLISISEKVLKNYAKWKELYDANRDIIKSPTVIFPGQKLKLPADKK